MPFALIALLNNWLFRTSPHALGVQAATRRPWHARGRRMRGRAVSGVGGSGISPSATTYAKTAIVVTASGVPLNWDAHHFTLEGVEPVVRRMFADGLIMNRSH